MTIETRSSADGSLATSSIPGHLGEMHAGWITEQLSACGAIGPENRVEQFDVEAMGDGEGFLGELGRLNLAYSLDEAGAPSSVVAKTPSRLPPNRGLAVMMAAYENEIRFYKELAAEVGVRVPRCYGAVITPEPRSSVIANKVVGKLPGGLTVRLMGPLTKAAAKSPRRFGLLIEDLHICSAGDQVGGADYQTGMIALQTLARLHAATWESPLLDRAWLKPLDNNAAFVQGLFRRAWPVFLKRYERVLPTEVVTLGTYLLRRGDALLRKMAEGPRTLNHGDYRLDNIMFDRDDRTQVTIIDWQAIAVGKGVADLCYFLRTNLLPEVAESVELDLIRVYHDSLQENGVTGYTLEQCQADYRLALAWLLHRGALLVGLLDMSHERGQAIVDRAIERSVPALATVSPAELRSYGV